MAWCLTAAQCFQVGVGCIALYTTLECVVQGSTLIQAFHLVCKFFFLFPRFFFFSHFAQRIMGEHEMERRKYVAFWCTAVPFGTIVLAAQDGIDGSKLGGDIPMRWLLL